MVLLESRYASMFLCIVCNVFTSHRPNRCSLYHHHRTSTIFHHPPFHFIISGLCNKYKKITMKAVTLTLTFLSGIHAFAPTNPSSTTTSPNHGLQMTSSTTNNEEVSRRTALTQFIASTAFLTAAVPSIASAKDYEPDYRDIKQIYGLGMTLDNLKVKVSDPDTSATALDMVKMYNKDQKFYPGYARNFISKTVKNNADGDDRVGYIRAVGFYCLFRSFLGLRC